MSHSASIGLSPSEWKWITQNVINACHEQQAERNTLLSVSEGEWYWFLNDSSPPSTSLGSFLKASCSLERSYHPPRVPLCKVSRSGLAWNLNLILCEITRKAISPPSWVSFRNGICSTTNTHFSSLLESSGIFKSTLWSPTLPHPLLSFSVCRVWIWDLPQSNPVGEKDSRPSGIWAGPFQPRWLVTGQTSHPQC